MCAWWRKKRKSAEEVIEDLEGARDAYYRAAYGFEWERDKVAQEMNEVTDQALAAKRGGDADGFADAALALGNLKKRHDKFNMKHGALVNEAEEVQAQIDDFEDLTEQGFITIMERVKALRESDDVKRMEARLVDAAKENGAVRKSEKQRFIESQMQKMGSARRKKPSANIMGILTRLAAAEEAGRSDEEINAVRAELFADPGNPRKSEGPCTA